MSNRNIRIAWLLGFETAAFAIAALIHSGVLLHSHVHLKAAIAESVIALVLALGLLLIRLPFGYSRRLGIVVQAFALLGTCVGLFTIAIGVGPQSTGDLVFHAFIICVLIYGLVVACRGGCAPILDKKKHAHDGP